MRFAVLVAAAALTLSAAPAHAAVTLSAYDESTPDAQPPREGTRGFALSGGDEANTVTITTTGTTITFSVPAPETITKTTDDRDACCCGAMDRTTPST